MTGLLSVERNENPLKVTACRFADSENKGAHSNICVSDDELAKDEIISKLTPFQRDRVQLDESTGPFYGGKQDISGPNSVTVQQTVSKL
ncbi:hypothetical protein AVEN_191184-1 [Araneus ventricosus]|uniref:Uncharacterized protein n=1 Tax=Araneus ventricosus TaxID=182803 RepID=A0A4Y2QXN5_ARAVE|nr:hypothetical protein AVEN_191184-1 [Araneus ventricosus]